MTTTMNETCETWCVKILHSHGTNKEQMCAVLMSYTPASCEAWRIPPRLAHILHQTHSTNVKSLPWNKIASSINIPLPYPWVAPACWESSVMALSYCPSCRSLLGARAAREPALRRAMASLNQPSMPPWAFLFTKIVYCPKDYGFLAS